MKIKIKSDYLLSIQIVLLIVLSVSPVIPRGLSIMLLCALTLFSVSKGVFHNQNIDLIYVLLMIFLLLSAILDVAHTHSGQPYSLVNLTYPVYFTCGYFMVQNYEKKDFYRFYENIVFVLAILSYVGMSVYFINPSLIYSFPTYEQNGVTHHTIFFFNYLFSGDWMAVRNSGIAWEPGLFQILLNIAFQIGIQNFDGKKRFVRVIVYVGAILLTRSTIGYVAILINIISLIKKDKKYIVFLVVSIITFWISIYTEISYQLTYKLVGSSAFSSRYEPLVNAIKICWYRLFGLGSTQYDFLYKSENIGSFDSYTQILIRYGYPLLILIIGRLVKMFKDGDRNIAFIIILGLCSEPIWGCVLMAAIYFLKNDVKTQYLEESNGKEN